MSQQQYGDFINGRILFIEQYCSDHRMDFKKVLRQIEEETISRVDSDDRKNFLREKLFGGPIFPHSDLPNWLDKVFLEATSQVLVGCQAPLVTATSKHSCIPFEAARFNAKRQADTIFKLMFTGKTPGEWIRWSFPAVYRKCYGDEAGSKLKIVEVAPGHFGVITDNTGLEKASKIDCSTVIGYIYGALEKLGAGNITITHKNCLAEAHEGKRICSFDVEFKFPALSSDLFRSKGH